MKSCTLTNKVLIGDSYSQQYKAAASAPRLVLEWSKDKLTEHAKVEVES